MEADSFQADTEAFLAWLKEIGVQINPKMALLDLRAEGRGRGIVAAADFAEDEIVFSIPRSSVLNVRNAFADFAPEFAIETISNMPAWLGLVATMLSQGQQPNSKWGPYLAVLPRQLDSLIFWSDAELAELQASTVVNKIGRAGAEETFSKHIEPLGLAGYSPEMCHRVASVIMAYAFDIPEDQENKQDNEKGAADDADDLVSDDGEEEKTVLSMIPLADMLNADAERNNARLCCDNEELEMRTIKPIAKGEEIFNDYGQLPRSDLLRRYGYVTENYKIYDVAEISSASIINALTGQPLKISEQCVLALLSSEEAENRRALAVREDAYEDSYDLAYPGPDGLTIPDELLAFLYLLLLDEESTLAIQTSQSSLPSRSKLATELVGQVLTTLLQCREKEYATTVEEDEEILKANNLAHRARMAIQVRQGEKKVLRAAALEASAFTGNNKRMRIDLKEEPARPDIHQSGKRKAEDSTNSKKKGRHR
ncbi:putative ribosomal N-lysine methyltransferase 4 [Halenospora varia]|nr:putative ribosomal N-lysine methyltransferase 4 [Halenospora varia]